MAFITIPLFYDLDLLRFTTAAGGIARQPNLVLGQSDNINFLVQFVSSGVGYDLGDPSFIFAIKAINDTAGVYLVQSTSGIKQGSGTSTKYSFEVVLDSTELSAWLLTVTAVTNYAAISIRDATNEIVTLPALTCSILPDYTLVGTTPTSTAGTLIVDAGQTFTVHKTFAMPTTDGFNNYVLKTNGAGVGSWVADNAGTGTVTNVAFTGGLISVANPTGSVAMTVAGTSGGIPYFGSASTWATSGVMGAGALIVGGGAGATPTALAAVASGRVLTSAGTTTTPAYSSTITLGASGTLGTITLGNATSGTILITPPTGALGTPTLTLPITSTTLAGLAVAQTFTANQTFSGTIDIAATTSTAGQITQAGTRVMHFYTASGFQNIFIGVGAGNFNASAGSNVGIGRAALSGLVGGSNNVCIGDGVGYQITSGIGNMLIGQGAGVNLISGSNNCAVGVSSLGAVSSTSNNTAIGYQSLGSNTSSSSTGIGHNAGYYATGGSGTYIGQGAGIATTTIGGLVGVAITSGTNCTMLGQGSGSTSATGNYRTAIGSDSRCESNNAIKLGRDTLDVVILPKMTEAQLATAKTTLGTVKGAIAYCTDGVQADHVFYYNGTDWARLN